MKKFFTLSILIISVILFSHAFAAIGLISSTLTGCKEASSVFYSSEITSAIPSSQTILPAPFCLVNVGEIKPVSTFANEKAKDKQSMVFVILSHVRNNDDHRLWERCYNSIREFYPETPIIMIDDNSAVPISNDTLKNVTFIRSRYPGAGEILPYYYFLKHQWAEKMIFLHDSMLLTRAFKDEELVHPIKFHWYFDSHCWDDDLAINSLLSHLKHSQELIEYNQKKDIWNGCFGVASIIDLKVLQNIENKYSMIKSLKTVLKNRGDRCAFERVFGMVFFKEQYVDKDNCSNFRDVLNHPYYYSHIDDRMIEEIKLSYPSAIIKTWVGR